MSSVEYFLVDLAYCGTNISFASVCNVPNQPLGSSKNDFTGTAFQHLTFTIKPEMTR